MVSRLKHGDAKGLVIHKIDRSSRNYHDWAAISDLADAGIEFHIATESFDFNTYGGRMAADFMAVVAANYVRNLKNEIRKGQQGQLKNGLLPWAAPIGYSNNGAARFKTPDPGLAPLVKQAFELYATGAFSIRSLVTELDAKGLRGSSGKPLTKTGVEKMLSNPFYCGVILIRRTGQTYPGAHKPLISSALYQNVQQIKSGKTVKRSTRHNHLYRGLFRCQHCSRALIGEWQKGRVYYRCQTRDCVTKTVREDLIEAKAIELLSRLCLSENDLMRAQSRLPEIISPTSNDSDLSATKLQVGRNQSRLERLTDMLVDDVIDETTYHSKKQSLLIEQRRLEQEVAKLRNNRLSRGNAEKFLELATSLAGLYQSTDKINKRRVLEWSTSNRSVSGKSLYLEPSSRLCETHELLSVLSCALSRPNSRMFDWSVIDSIKSLESLQNANDDAADPSVGTVA
jgi:site-specific DNA recombinase